ncbi:MAG: hypothetical protein ACI8PB_005099 [Desulforhopalus sp.]|jgi:hypothetical protein
MVLLSFEFRSIIQNLINSHSASSNKPKHQSLQCVCRPEDEVINGLFIDKFRLDGSVVLQMEINSLLNLNSTLPDCVGIWQKLHHLMIPQMQG